MLKHVLSAIVFVLVLLGADYAYSAASNLATNLYLHSLDGPIQLTSEYAKLEGLLSLSCGGVFYIAGATLWLLWPGRMPSTWPPLALGLAWAAFLYLILPFVPLARYGHDHNAWWLLAIASLQYVLPPLASVAGATCAVRLANYRLAGLRNEA